jgi:hypothetical protein
MTPREVWRSAYLSCAAIGILVLVTGVVRHLRVPAHPVGLFAAISAYQLALAALLYLRRARPSLWLASLASLAATLALVPGQWHSMSIGVAVSNRFWTPFQGVKLLSMFIALIGPELPWLIVTEVTVLLSSALIQFQTFPADIRARYSADEPWATLIYGMLALILFYYRYRRHQAARHAARAEEESASLQRLARLFMAVRDLTNTPLQTLQIGLELLDRQHPDIASKLSRMKRSLVRLHELDRILSRYENEVDWRGSESFDARQILANELPPEK